MAEDFKEDRDEKSENRSQHPVVQAKGSVDLEFEMLDFLIETRDVLANFCEMRFHVG